ncbi:hypothetical protein P3T36_006833 [Kitasatospora sp. MAP12-15]|uniref:ScbA/BarX family gamma-butyrolactone biosynthesis protein n=1 Tax=unclassified Kitasatospora TaxID=2633591 RepID=UPI002476CAFC|nr:ScbA/BarX family gamma-butyrolactone biosynthesis protein [Kitasatospora sp. MAP12-44]MDH6112140.1 hypothetical protein [Kitasatospora sp. MAP12-44]
MHQTLLAPPAAAGIARELVHLTTDESVLLTGWTRHTPNRFSLTARWPAATSGASSTGSRRPDPLLVPQTVRQSGLLIAHAEFDVPLGYQTLLEQLDLTLAADPRLPVDRPALLDVELVCTEAGRHGRRLTGLDLDIAIRHDGRLVARSATRFSWISPAVYRRLRGERATVTGWGEWPLPAPVPPTDAGRATAPEVLLSPTGRPLHWQLRCDPANRVLFDHPVDHVPGLALHEAACQAAAQCTSTLFAPTSAVTTFSRYVEFDAPCWIEASTVPSSSPDTVTVLVTGRQAGAPAFHSTFTGPAVAGS